MQVIRKTSTKARDEIVHYFWKRIHQQELENLRRNKKNTSIYKSASMSKANNFETESRNKDNKAHYAQEQDKNKDVDMHHENNENKK